MLQQQTSPTLPIHMQGVILAEKGRSLGPLHCYFTRTAARLRPFIGRLFGHRYARYMHRKCWRGLSQRAPKASVSSSCIVSRPWRST